LLRAKDSEPSLSLNLIGLGISSAQIIF
jgi:hypothetical protein